MHIWHIPDPINECCPYQLRSLNDANQHPSSIGVHCHTNTLESTEQHRKCKVMTLQIVWAGNSNFPGIRPWHNNLYQYLVNFTPKATEKHLCWESFSRVSALLPEGEIAATERNKDLGQTTMEDLFSLAMALHSQELQDVGSVCSKLMVTFLPAEEEEGKV